MKPSLPRLLAALFFHLPSLAQLTGGQPAQAWLTVDLDYGVYTGVYNASSKLAQWRGIRYAAAPVGPLRWQAPRPPPESRTPVVANTYPPYCPQSFAAQKQTTFVPGYEDCLFLSVFAPRPSPAEPGRPSPASSQAALPVLVWIHGGGYGLGNAWQDMSDFLNANDNGMLAVVIQYRLGAFGFAASPEIKKRGVLNAGLLDQKFALEWIQKHISKFGGDPRRVTISGESAGGGSVALHAVAQGGALGTSLFQNIIGMSPWVPTQPYYGDPISVRNYYNFSKAAGCPQAGEVFDCLVGKDTLSLQYASNLVSQSPPTVHGNWAFIPVTDGDYVTGPPSVVFADPNLKVNGLRVLLGNNANEGSLIVPSGIVTQDDLISWMREYYFNLSPTNITSLLEAYPSSSGPVNTSDAKFETDGFGPATAVNVSQVGTGQQQRAYNLYSEGAGGCQKYWLNTAFSRAGLSSWAYQYSVPFAIHGADISAYWGPPTPNQSPEFVLAFRKIIGNFVVHDNPSIPDSIANGASPAAVSPHPASNWPRWTDSSPVHLILNTTGGTPYKITAPNGVPVTQFAMARNNLTIANAYAWEGGRGRRCEVWRIFSPIVPQ